MAPTEALQMLDNAASQVATNREGHVRLQQAVQCINEALQPVTKPDAVVKPDKK